MTGSQVLTALSQLRGHTPSTLEHWQTKAERLNLIQKGKKQIFTASPLLQEQFLCLFAQTASVQVQTGGFRLGLGTQPGTRDRNPRPHGWFLQAGSPLAKPKLSVLEMRGSIGTHVCVSGLEDRTIQPLEGSQPQDEALQLLEP